MQYEMNKMLLPYLYDNTSIPNAILKFGLDMNTSPVSDELQERADMLLVYRDYIVDKKMIYRLRATGYELMKAIRTKKEFSDLRFTITGRRKSLYGVDDKITDCQAKGLPISIGDILGLRIVVHNIEPQEYMEDEFKKLALFIVKFFKDSGFVPMLAQPLKGTDAFDPKKHPGIYVPSEILPKGYQPYAKDYVAHPKENGYQTLQGVMADPDTNKVFEWQLRTMSMHVHAEVLSARHDGYKKGKIANRQTDGNESLETEAVDYSRIKMYGFMATGLEKEPFIDMAGLLESQSFLQCQRISSLVAEQ